MHLNNKELIIFTIIVTLFCKVESAEQQYYLTRGSENCLQADVISKKGDCETAARRMGLLFYGELSSTRRPSGCNRNIYGHVRFNGFTNSSETFPRNNYYGICIDRETEEKTYCIKIITTGGQQDDGYLTLSINYIDQFQDKRFEKNQLVIKKCFSSFLSIGIQGPRYDGWVGTIVLEYEGVKRDLRCINGCDVTSFDGTIAVDGDNDRKEASTWCHNRNYCILVLEAEIEPPDTGRISSTTTKRGSSSQTINTSATLTTSYNDTITENTITSTLRRIIYFLSDFGSLCSEVNNATVTTLQECKRAGKEIEKSLSLQIVFKSENSWPVFPKGCFLTTNNHLHLNTHLTGNANIDTRQVCRSKEEGTPWIMTSSSTSLSNITKSTNNFSQMTTEAFSTTERISIYETKTSTDLHMTSEDLLLIYVYPAIGGAVGLITISIIVLVTIICWKKRKNGNNERDELNIGCSDDHSGYDSLYLHDNPNFMENESNDQLKKSQILEEGATSVKTVENPYYGVEADSSEPSGNEKEKTENIVVIQNPYYE